MVRYLFLLLTGTVIGAYISQNYFVPDIKKMIENGISVATKFEQTFRKPDK